MNIYLNVIFKPFKIFKPVQLKFKLVDVQCLNPFWTSLSITGNMIIQFFYSYDQCFQYLNMKLMLFC